MKRFLLLTFAVFAAISAHTAQAQVMSGYQGQLIYNKPVAIPSGTFATGSVTLGSNPADTDTLTLGGTTITFVAGTPSGSQVQIGGTNLITTASLLSFLQGSSDTNLVKCTYTALSTNGITLTNTTVGSAGNSFTLAKSSSAITLSGATLTGGAQAASPVIDMHGFSLAGILLPATFTSTTLTFTASVDGTNFYALKSTTSGSALSYTVAQGTYAAIDPVAFYGIRYLKIVTGSAEGATRTLTLALKGI